MTLAAEMVRLSPFPAGPNLEERAACTEACFDCVLVCTACADACGVIGRALSRWYRPSSTHSRAPLEACRRCEAACDALLAAAAAPTGA